MQEIITEQITEGGDAAATDAGAVAIKKHSVFRQYVFCVAQLDATRNVEVFIGVKHVVVPEIDKRL